MTKADLSDIYRDYIARLNKQDWPNLGQFVHEEVYYNDEGIGLSGYREMLEGDFRPIADLYFDVRLLIFEPPRVASRLHFDYTPIGILFGLSALVRKLFLFSTHRRNAPSAFALRRTFARTFWNQNKC